MADTPKFDYGHQIETLQDELKQATELVQEASQRRDSLVQAIARLETAQLMQREPFDVCLVRKGKEQWLTYFRK